MKAIAWNAWNGIAHMAPTPQDLAIVHDVVTNILPSSLDVKTHMHKTQRHQTCSLCSPRVFSPSKLVDHIPLQILFLELQPSTYMGCVCEMIHPTQIVGHCELKRKTLLHLQRCYSTFVSKSNFALLSFLFFVFHGVFLKSCSYGVPKCLLKFRMFKTYYVDLV